MQEHLIRGKKGDENAAIGLAGQGAQPLLKNGR